MNPVAAKLREQLHFVQGNEPLMALLKAAAEEIERLDPDEPAESESLIIAADSKPNEYEEK